MASAGFSYRVLVVDDDSRTLHVSRLILEEKGYEVRTSADGFEALVELRRSLPDILISDLRMPNMSGFELLSVVRRRFPQIPVIAISGEFDGDSPVGLIAEHSSRKRNMHLRNCFGKLRHSLSNHRCARTSQNRIGHPSGFRVAMLGTSLSPAPTAYVHFQFPLRNQNLGRRYAPPPALFAVLMCAISRTSAG